MKKLIALLVTGLSVAIVQQQATAQELLISPNQMEMEGLTPELALPPMPSATGEIFEDGVPYSDSDSISSELSTPGSVIEGESFSPDIYTDYGETYHCDQAVLESTGSWLRRGFWYAEVDAVISNRKWSRDTIVLANQITGQTVVSLPNGAQIQVTTENQLRVNGRRPGAEAAPRLTLGHFLFRDRSNRDHVAEFTAYGGGEWTEEAILDFNPNTDVQTVGLLVPTLVDAGNLSFSGAQSSNFRYDSRFNSFELNYLVKDRMGKDRMEMEPSGQWVRRAGATFSTSYLAGLRYFDLSENFNWEASGIDPDGDPNTQENVDDDLGLSSIRTDNDLIGTQLGLGGLFETARWSAGVETKGGLYLNMIDMQSIFSRTQNLTDDNIFNDSALEDDQLSFIGEAALVGRYHLKPNFSLRASFEFLYVTSVAIAPSQYPESLIASGPTRIYSSGESTWMGGGIGFEGYW